MRKARIAVLVSGGGTNLQAILDAQAAGKLPHGQVALVVSNRTGAYALERARAAGVEALTLTRGIELIVLAGFLSILSEDFTGRWPRRILNVHPSLIPAFCGAGFYGLKVHEAALERGVKVTGATVHFVNEIPDGGEIIYQKAVRIQPGDTPEVLQRRVMEQAEWKLLPRAVELVSREIVRERKGNQ